MPDYRIERSIGAQRIAGVDEVGRGPLAGPVVAAAVVLRLGSIPAGLNDSKKLSPGRRAELTKRLRDCAEVSVGMASVEEIDHLNILRASHVAMCRAIEGLPTAPDHCLIDGNMVPRDLVCPATAVIKGDANSLSIAAASIVAKQARDQIMVDLAQQYPGYDWGKNMGYPTARHKAAMLELGITPHHRRSFAPVHNILCREKL